MARYFTREEAEELLPQIRVVLHDMQQAHATMRDYEEELNILETRARGNGHHLHERITKLQTELARQMQTLRSMAAQLETFGCELKDPATGLIDFLSLRDGHEVYLCWRLGEARIDYWHEIESGFSGRQLL